MSTELTAPTKIEVDPITTALVAAGVTSASIEALAKDYGELAKLTEITTEEQYDEVHKAQIAHRDIRTAVVAALKEEREEAKRYQTFVISEEKRLVGAIEKTELPLKKLKDEWNNKIELKAQEEARQWMEKMNLRKQAAFDIGYYFNGQAYLLDRENGEAPWVLREDQVAGMAMSDEALYALLEAQAAELKMTREIKAEAEAKAEEERQAQAVAQKAEADRIAAAQAELARKQNEMDAREAQMNARVNEARKNELLAMGLSYGEINGIIYVPTIPGSQPSGTVSVAELYLFDEERWGRMVSEFDLALDRYSKWTTAREEQMKAEAAERAVAEERERAQRLRDAEEEAAARAAQKEVERIASMGDKGLVEQLSAYLVCAPVPDLHTAVGQHGMARVRKHLVDLTNMVNSIAKDL